MNNRDFITELSSRLGISLDETQQCVQVVVDAMASCFDEGENVQIPSFGTFELKKRMERVVVNPSTKERMLVPPKLVLAFKPVKSLKDKFKKRRDDE
ncbi:MAG: HU family DNA-binding protein [Prevotella sp.]|nr:HU family DNA-binding protein [Prevotella sp.]